VRGCDGIQKGSSDSWYSGEYVEWLENKYTTWMNDIRISGEGE